MKYGLGNRNKELLGTSTLAELCKSFSDYRLLVHGIFAVGWPDSGKFSSVEELKFPGKASSHKRKGGMGFLISKEAQGALLERKLHSESNRFLTPTSTEVIE